MTVLADFRNTSIINCFQEAVAVVKEIGSLFMHLADQFIVVAQSFVYKFLEAFWVFVQHFGTLFKGQTLWAVTAVVWYMAGSLVGEQVNVDVFLQQVFQQVNNVAVVSDRTRLFCFLCFQSPTERLFQTVGVFIYPALCITGHDTGNVNLSDDRSSASNISSFTLCTGHAA